MSFPADNPLVIFAPMEPVTVNFFVPTAWHELSDRQLRYVYSLIAADFSTDEVRLLCLFRWNKVKVVAQEEDGLYLLRKGKTLFHASPVQLAEILASLEWLGALPSLPVRPASIGRHRGLAADFSEVPLQVYIMADNLYQGYLATLDDGLLDQLATILYNSDSVRPSASERVAIFYWMASLKEFFAHRYPDFFQPAGAATDGNLLGSSSPSVEESMNAQIRALTKGDVTKEQEVLALDTWRALNELNAQAKEYKQFHESVNAKK